MLGRYTSHGTNNFFICISGKGQRIAKEVLKELINGPEGKMLVGFFGTGAVMGVIFVIWLLLN
ncbi:hypothetical protein [Bacillus cereus]|uniref:hypothetical protein n=1 Tax=Bacillus cereus TaxID=1396 RepID=UPI003C2ABCF6